MPNPARVFLVDDDPVHLLILEQHYRALGAARMSELCARVEVAAREGRIAEVRAMLDALLVERQSVKRALLQEIGDAS